MMNILIGTAYAMACDVTRKKFLVEHFLILKNEPHPLFFYIEDFLSLKC